MSEKRLERGLNNRNNGNNLRMAGMCRELRTLGYSPLGRLFPSLIPVIPAVIPVEQCPF